MKEAGLPEPIFDTKGFFTVIFIQRPNENIDSLDEPINDPINAREKDVFNLIRMTGGLRRNHIADKLKVSEVTIKRSLQKLTGLSLIEYRGS